MRHLTVIALVMLATPSVQAQDKSAPPAAKADLADLLSRLDKADPEKLKLGIELLRQTNEALTRYERLRDDLRGLLQGSPVRIRAGGLNFGFSESTRLGVDVDRPGAALMHQLDLAEGFGLVVVRVGEGSAAARAGIRPYDILLECGGQNVPSDPVDFERIVAGIKNGAPVSITLLRRGKEMRAEVSGLPAAAPSRATVEVDLFPEAIQRLRSLKGR